MSASPQKPKEGEQFLILAPIGKDGELLRTLLSEASLPSEILPTMAALCARLVDDVTSIGGVLLAEEALTRNDATYLVAALKKQPAWSDLPFVLLTKRIDDSRAIRFLLGALEPANVTLLERPLSSVTLLSSVLAALRTRQRQFEIKRLLEEKEQALAEVSRSNAELAQFAFVASHDLKEPLRIVSTYVQMIEKREVRNFSESGLRYFRFIVDSVERMYGLIDDLLLFSNLGGEALRPEPIDTREIVEEVLINLSATINETGAQVRFHELPRVIAQRNQLIQLFQNLVSNALKYRSNVPPIVDIDAQERGGDFVFSVRDNGLGIEGQYFERIFVLFQRLHRKDEYSGTGIGLAICKKVVERHGGKIWVESIPGKGSTFHFSLPKPEAA